MNPVPAEVWRQIEPSRPKGDELVGRQALPDITPRLLAAINASGHHHLLVALDPVEGAFRDVSSRGLTVETEELVLPGYEHARYIKLKCHDAAAHVMFDLIGGEIAERLRVGAAPADAVSAVLARWRRFWSQQSMQLLTREEQVGLFAELWFLTYWLIPAIGGLEALRRWRGTHGARHDFEHPGLSIEIKGTSSTRGRTFRVNSIQQLDPPESGRLMFFGVRLREEAGASNTLPLLVQVCRRLAAEHADAEGMLDTALIAAGYVEAHREEYEKTRWRVIEALLFDVRADFPKITPGTFISGVPAGVEEVDYVINLDTFDHLVIAREPAEAATLFGT